MPAALSNERNIYVLFAAATVHMLVVKVYSISAKSGNLLTLLTACWVLFIFINGVLVVAPLKRKVSG